MILLINLVFWAIYRLEIPFIEQFKVEKNQPWPWNADPVGWRVQVKKAIKQLIFNAVFVNFLGLVFTSYMHNWQLPWRMDIESLPSAWEMVKQIGIVCLMEDFAFHFSHRTLHCKSKYFPMYQMIHKQHHEFNHPVSIAAEYAHPIEFLIGDHYTFFFGPLVLGSRMHFLTFLLWGIFRTFETHDAHCGYEFPWTLFRLVPFGCDATYHVFHHSKNVGNYSTFMTVWDTILDSNKDFYEAYPEGSYIAHSSKKDLKVKKIGSS